MTTAILNLVTNARHAMPQSGTLTIETYYKGFVATTAGTLSRHPNQNYVGLRLSDTGVGIPLEIQKRVFEPFFTTKEVGSGTGLGLSIVKRLMDELGGGLALTSTPGKGSIFDLYFNTSEAVVAEAEGAGPEKHAKGERVLYVEDNETVRQQTESMLRQIGTVPVAFGTGREALEWIRNGGEADLLFTDLVLPGGMSGLDLAIEVTRHRPDLPVLITTGYDPRASLSEAKNKNFPVLRKPYTRRALATAVIQELR